MRKRAEFTRVNGGAKASSGACVVLAMARAGASDIGIGLTASRRVGGAVIRNRAKRRLREAFRLLARQFARPGCDYVLIATPATAELAWQRLLDDLKRALIRLGRSLEPPSSPD